MRVRRVVFLAVAWLGPSACLCLIATASLCQRGVALQGSAGRYYYVASSPNGNTLALASNRTIRLWDVPTRKERAALRGHTADVRSLVFSPGGNSLASAGEDWTVRLWDVRTGEERATFLGHTDSVGAVAFSPDGATLASGSSDATIILWDVATGQRRAILSGHTRRVASVAFSPDGRTLASGSWDGTVRLWNVPTGEERAVLPADRYGADLVAFSPDGKALVSVVPLYARVRLWDLTKGKERPFTYPDWLSDPDEPRIGYLAFSPDGKTLALGTFDVVGLWDLASGKNTASFGLGQRPLDLSISSAVDSLGVFKDARQTIRSAWFTPDGKLVAFGEEGGTLKTWTGAATPDSEAGLVVRSAIALVNDWGLRLVAEAVADLGGPWCLAALTGVAVLLCLTSTIVRARPGSRRAPPRRASGGWRRRPV